MREFMKQLDNLGFCILSDPEKRRTSYPLATRHVNAFGERKLPVMLAYPRE